MSSYSHAIRMHQEMHSSDSSHSRMSSPRPQSPSSQSSLTHASLQKPIQEHAGSQSQTQQRMTKMQVPDPIGSSVSIDAGLNDYIHGFSSSPVSGSSMTQMPPAAQIASNGGIRHNVQMIGSMAANPVSLRTASPLETTSASPIEVPVSQTSNTENRCFSFQLDDSPNAYQNLSLSPGGSSTVASNPGMSLSNSSDGYEATDRKQKRLQRNRESARLSRRRRKQYLVVLEDRVNYLCEAMDKGRRDHVLRALTDVQLLRDGIVNGLEQSTILINGRMQNLDDISQKVEVLVGGKLSRASTELMHATTFGREYLKSLVIDPAKKYIMWLTLQNDTFYRGGRAASERLSAARIGEKLRSSGYTHVTPSNGMWPLFCNEVALSYDQEERMRQLQKEIISNQESWLHRHTGAASEHVIESSRDAISGTSEKVQNRNKNLISVLTPIQKVKFLAWIAKKRKNDAQKLNAVKSQFTGIDKFQDAEVNPQRHDAANLYILNHKLAIIANSYQRSNQKVLNSKTLKSLSRRPAFESLASVDDTKCVNPKKMDEVGSSNALKRHSSEMNFDGVDGTGFLKSSTSGGSLCGMSSLTPEAAQTTSSAHVYKALGNITNFIPSHRLPRPVAPLIQNDQPTPNSVASQQHLASAALFNPQPQQAMISGPNQVAPVSFLRNALLPIDGEEQHQQPYQTVCIPEPVPVVPLSNPTAQIAIHSLPLNPVPLVPLSNLASIPLVVPEAPIPSSAISAPLFGAFSKVPSPLCTFAKEEVPEVDDVKFYNVSNQMADDSLFGLTEEDWAIGQGTFWD